MSATYDWKNLHSVVTITAPDYHADPNWPRRAKADIVGLMEKKLKSATAMFLDTLERTAEEDFYLLARYRLENGGCRQ